jgi:NADPH2:quinone reductase
VISAVGRRTVEINLIHLYHNETQILGVDSRKLDVVESGARLALLTPYFESGKFHPLPITPTSR